MRRHSRLWFLNVSSRARVNLPLLIGACLLVAALGALALAVSLRGRL